MKSYKISRCALQASQAVWAGPKKKSSRQAPLGAELRGPEVQRGRESSAKVWETCIEYGEVMGIDGNI